ncbi:hypothetical protein BJ165DRAFT_1404264 [Panaeolus papilionaceus]|nr:hypothetical protein BJ165DRAFT_1404264 [Panaeolus papilionaceus]
MVTTKRVWRTYSIQRRERGPNTIEHSNSVSMRFQVKLFGDFTIGKVERLNWVEEGTHRRQARYTPTGLRGNSWSGAELGTSTGWRLLAGIEGSKKGRGEIVEWFSYRYGLGYLGCVMGSVVLVGMVIVLVRGEGIGLTGEEEEEGWIMHSN